MLAIEYHVHIWLVSPQLSYGDTCQIWRWFNKSGSYFCKIENFAYREINKQSLSNPPPPPPPPPHPPPPLSKIQVKIHTSWQGYPNLASDWMVAVLPANQMPGLKIFVN